MAGATGLVVSSSETLYGSCQGSGYAANNSAAYTMSGTTTYLATTFNEQTAGTVLAGSTPAICANGCVGPWVQLSGSPDWSYKTGGGIGVTVSTAGADYINFGVSNSTIRWTVTANSGTIHVFARYNPTVNPTDYLNIQMDGAVNTVTPLNIVVGTGTIACSVISGTTIGNYTLVLTGTAFTLTAPAGSCSGTIGSLEVGTYCGLIEDAGTASISSLTVESN